MAQADTKQKEFKFTVAMACGGCSGAIKRVLDKKQLNHTISLEDQTVRVDDDEKLAAAVAKVESAKDKEGAQLDSEKHDFIAAIIKKTGKEIKLPGEKVEKTKSD